MTSGSLAINPLFVRPGESREHPRFALADDEMLPETANQNWADIAAATQGA